MFQTPFVPPAQLTGFNNMQNIMKYDESTDSNCSLHSSEQVKINRQTCLWSSQEKIWKGNELFKLCWKYENEATNVVFHFCALSLNRFDAECQSHFMYCKKQKVGAEQKSCTQRRFSKDVFSVHLSLEARGLWVRGKQS